MAVHTWRVYTRASGAAGELSRCLPNHLVTESPKRLLTWRVYAGGHAAQDGGVVPLIAAQEVVARLLLVEVARCKQPVDAEYLCLHPHDQAMGQWGD